MSAPADKQLVRPRQVTLAGWMIVFSSVAVLLGVFEQVAALHSLETSRTIERALSEPPLSDLGVDVAGARTFLRIFAMVAGACATAAAILGYQVLQRSRSARLALAVVMVPLFITGFTSGGLFSSVVVAAAVMLWLQPARDWFDGKAPATPAAAAIAHGPRAARSALPPLEQQRQPGPPAPGQSVEGQPVQGQPGAQAPWAPPARPYGAPVPPAAHPGHPAQPAVRGPRPSALVAGVVMTWVGSGLAGLVAVLATGGVIIDRGPIDDVLADNPDAVAQGVTPGLLLGIVIAMMGVFVLWCVVAAVLGALVWRGRAWAFPLLVVSAGVAALSSVVGLLASGVMVLPLVLCAGAMALLLRPESRAWVRPDVR